MAAGERGQDCRWAEELQAALRVGFPCEAEHSEDQGLSLGAADPRAGGDARLGLYSEMLSSILSLHPLGALARPPDHDNQKHLQTLPNVPEKAKVPLVYRKGDGTFPEEARQRKTKALLVASS